MACSSQSSPHSSTRRLKGGRNGWTFKAAPQKWGLLCHWECHRAGTKTLTPATSFVSTGSSAQSPTDSTQTKTGIRVKLGVFLKQDLGHKPDFSFCAGLPLMLDHTASAMTTTTTTNNSTTKSLRHFSLADLKEAL